MQPFMKPFFQKSIDQGDYFLTFMVTHTITDVYKILLESASIFELQNKKSPNLFQSDYTRRRTEQKMRPTEHRILCTSRRSG